MHGATESESGVARGRAGRMWGTVGRTDDALVMESVEADNKRDRQGRRRNSSRQRSWLCVEAPCTGETGLVGCVLCFVSGPGELGKDQGPKQQEHGPHLTAAVQERGPFNTEHGKLRTICGRPSDDTAQPLPHQASGTATCAVAPGPRRVGRARPSCAGAGRSGRDPLDTCQ